MKCFLFASFVLLVASLVAETPHASRVVIERSSRTLTLEFPDGTKESYKVSLGRAGANCNRTRAGDDCTPTGSFFIVSKHLSQRFHKFLLLSYPDEDAATRGLQSELISQSQYESIQAALSARKTPPQNTALGGDIGIHGQPRWVPSFLSSTVRRFDWTAACISVTDTEIDHIYDTVDVGTPVAIK